ASHRCAAEATSAASTDCRSKAERLMMRSTSAVAASRRCAALSSRRSSSTVRARSWSGLAVATVALMKSNPRDPIPDAIGPLEPERWRWFGSNPGRPPGRPPQIDLSPTSGRPLVDLWPTPPSYAGRAHDKTPSAAGLDAGPNERLTRGGLAVPAGKHAL